MIIMNLDATIGSNLARLREAANVSLDNAAYAMRKRGYKWTKMTIHNIEYGDRQIRGAEIYDYLDCLGYAPENTMKELYRTDASATAQRKLENVKTTMRNFMLRWNTLCEAIHDCQELLGSESAKDELGANLLSDYQTTLDLLSDQAKAFCTCLEVSNLQPVDDIDSYLRTEPEQLPAYCFDEEGNLKDPMPDDVDGATE